MMEGTPGTRAQAAADRIVAVFDRLRWPLLALCVPVLGVSAWQATNVGVDNAVDVWFVEGDPVLDAYDAFQARYGNDEVVALAVHDADGVLDVDGFRRIDAVTRAAASIDGIAEVVSVTDVDHLRTDDTWVPVEGEAPPLVVGPAVEDLPQTPDEAATLRARLLADPMIAGRLVDEGGTTALVVARMQAQDDLDAVRDGELAELYAAVDGLGGPRVERAGMGVVFSALNVASTRDAGLMGGLSYALIAALMVFLFRRVGPVALAFGVVAGAVVVTFGLFGAFDRDLNMVTLALPTLLLITGVADCVHMLHRIAIQPPGDAGQRARTGVAEVFWPCVFTSLTTAGGFVSLGTARMQVVRDLGWFAAAGVIAAWVLTMVAVLIAGRSSWFEPRERSMDWLRRAADRAADLAIGSPGLVLSVSALVTLLGAFGVSKLESDTWSIQYFYGSHPVRQDSDAIEAGFGPYTPLELVVKGPGLRNAADLQAIAAWQDAMEQDPTVGTTYSAADVVRRLNQVLTDGADASYVVPDDDLQIDQALFLYENDPEADLDSLVDPDWTELRVTVTVPMLSAKGFGETIDRLTALARLPEGRTIVPTGYIPLYVQMMDYIVASQISSFALAFVVIFGLLAILFRSFRLALLAVPPNILPIFLTLGVMGAAGIRLDVATVTIAALIMGSWWTTPSTSCSGSATSCTSMATTPRRCAGRWTRPVWRCRRPRSCSWSASRCSASRR
jgi:predicted RND superfamily exporter protein